MPTQSEIGYNSKIEGDVVVTTVDAALNWFRANSVWPMPMGLACCAIELMAVGASRFDISRFGSEVMRFSPRQADCMIVAGTVTYKMAGAVKRIWDQMPEPKWCIAMGACASTGGMYRSYAVLQGVDNIIPVDVYVSGCPPRPEACPGRADEIAKQNQQTQPVLQNLTALNLAKESCGLNLKFFFAKFSNVTSLETAQKLKAKFGDLISEPAEFRGEVTVKVADAEQIVVVCEFCQEAAWLRLSRGREQPRQLRRRPALDGGL